MRAYANLAKPGYKTIFSATGFCCKIAAFVSENEDYLISYDCCSDIEMYLPIDLGCKFLAVKSIWLGTKAWELETDYASMQSVNEALTNYAPY